MANDRMDDFVPGRDENGYRVTEDEFILHGKALRRFLAHMDESGMPVALYVEHGGGMHSAVVTDSAFPIVCGRDTADKVKRELTQSSGRCVIMTVADQ